MAAPTFTSAVTTNGAEVTLTFSESVTGVLAREFYVTANGNRRPIRAVSGSGTTWTLELDDWLLPTEAVRVVYWGSSVINGGAEAMVPAATYAATNSSTMTVARHGYMRDQFGMFVHWTLGTFNDNPGLDVGDLNPDTFAPTGDIYEAAAQWMTTAAAAGCRYVILTVNHAGGFCLWPTAASPYNITESSWWAANGQPDIVEIVASAARNAGLGIGFYLNNNYRWWKNHRPGATGAITGTDANGNTFVECCAEMISELVNNYGSVEVIWVDGFVSETNELFEADEYYVTLDASGWATLRAPITAAQPSCLLVANHETDLLSCDLVIVEANVQSELPAGNVLPAEFCESVLTSHQWIWTAAANVQSVDALYSRFGRLRANRVNYLLNAAPDRSGSIPAAQVTAFSELGLHVGRANTILRKYVRSGVDRGDGITGTASGGINGSAILGMP